MKKISKYKIDKWVLIPLLIFALISIITIYSAQTILPSYLQNLALRQIIWYVVGFGLAYFMMFIGNDFIYDHAWVLYGIGILSLIGLFFFGTDINDARCWYTIPGVGTIQPSEFMKIILIITLGTIIHDFNENFSNPSLMEEFKFLIKVGIIVLFPSILTFLQPDTGVVLIYLLITFVMLFISGIRYRWFIIAIGLLLALVGVVLGIYFINQDLFVDIFGTSFFLRVDRLLDWSNKSGYQLENGLLSIGSGGIFGTGIKNTPLYFPEAQTDFVFAVYASNFGFIGSMFLILLLLFFDIRLIQIALKSRSNKNKYVIAGIVGMLIYQQIQNIGMTIGLMPITGITLPFISYGGSSLLSYMIMAGIIFNISNETLRYTN
ncbi:MAG TPA: FtsW/RodA/SpoVE family cell cycle protein [Candidatus Pelethosoma merdigallinarum]|nr:FtsW/RodA/SpoVE family cell cycle protein [Candidatus Pelethosoma merdigallinarum]